ncbi:dynein heavy chain 1, axonemal, partial [Kipferlia bialata]
VQTLVDFQQAQRSASRRTSSHLRESRSTFLRNALQAAIHSCGKGWFNINEKSHDSYERSGLKRLFNRVNYMFSDSIRTLVTDGVGAYLHLFDVAAWDVDVRTPGLVINVHPDNPDIPGLEPTTVGRRGPLFLIELSLSDVHPNASEMRCLDALADNQYSLPAEEEEAEADTETEEETEPEPEQKVHFQLLQGLIWGHDSYVSVPVMDEDWLVAALDTLKANALECQEPLLRYLSSYEQYAELILLDEERWASYIRDRAMALYKDIPLRSGDTPLGSDALGKVVHKQMDRAWGILRDIPTRVHVGAFVVSTTAVRKWLSDKCLRLANHAREIIVEIAEDRALHVSEQFSGVMIRLRHKNKTIEDVVET